MSTQTSTNPKPVLHGSVQEANAKHEPEKGDLEAISSKLDILGNTLDYRKYGDSLFEILITGGIIEPGGTIDSDAKQSPFCLFTAKDDAVVIKKYVEVFNKLIRRYKYLQRTLDETLQNMLQNINKWPSDQTSKLAKSTGFFVCSQLVPLSALKVLLKDYLVKYGHALDFATTVLRTILEGQGIGQLGR
ncbi:hypothetical protein G6F57_006616 [Rhizopus arrhizus]|uniref:5MP1/2-like HEAT domain-containing protein n=1 Tax=Rhizopus oryzae TaxID=64495 RepID=A0A9P6X9A1_RHIOR|nr:hypothetical protein G6F23_002986 [Rhizopus arrhizus]KAG1419979.1 hypothetical protein G6F58_004374 [Rhizopus delemar]KAG0767031.1 hypothetical protein G6F24_003133 [Rhizopus arrhizus]KAG0788554.1 hypothetical protein G6F21_007134 [Rhizopus arrhizus]KAG0789870.1 hypothetical protein G6F22_006577 [Rhizopus arrhizus]